MIVLRPGHKRPFEHLPLAALRAHCDARRIMWLGKTREEMIDALAQHVVDKLNERDRR